MALMLLSLGSHPSFRGFGQGGFSLLELVVVVAVIGTLLAITAADFTAWQEDARIEKQAREIRSDIMQARLSAIHSKRQHVLTLNERGYLLKNYSSEHEPVTGGTEVAGFTKKFPYQLTNSHGSPFAGFAVQIDPRGLTSNVNTIVLNHAGRPADYDCISISVARTRLGKVKNGACVTK